MQLEIGEMRIENQSPLIVEAAAVYSRKHFDAFSSTVCSIVLDEMAKPRGVALLVRSQHYSVGSVRKVRPAGAR